MIPIGDNSFFILKVVYFVACVTYRNKVYI